MDRLDDLRARTDWQHGRISPLVHFDEDVYRREQERVFGRAWLVVGHEDMIRKPGDYVSSYMGEVPVVLTRDDNGAIHVLVNKCAHRGVAVCLFDRGNTKSFTCSYHGWVYDIAGGLIGVPMERQLYRDELDKKALGLERLPNVASFHGLVFASFDSGAPPLPEWLGEDVAWWLETFVLAVPCGGLEALAGWHRNASPGNWKLVAENFIGDDYHVPFTHASWWQTRRELHANGIRHSSLAASQEPATRYEESAGFRRGCPLGLGVITFGDGAHQQDLDEARGLGPEAVAWVEERRRRLEAALTDRELKPNSFQNGLLFPNLGLMGFVSPLIGRHFLLFHPRGARSHEVWQWTMVEKDAPAAVKELAVQRVYRGQHMAGVVAPDDVENFERLVDASAPARNWERPFHYGMQLGHEEEGPHGLPGNLGPNPSEVNQRLFYRFWLDLMDREPVTAGRR